ncbi:hypothetical protein CANINC_002855 [Pichia inconspicua]|uniref:cysteine--tRNA ligase n=1 Tax=Pichia inconspicua TaxID=52247 RepID=A0A4T0X0L8_9ASCO|nr:hypothetical protein CANINC_002855 [[Candida] inconspicua]
MTTESTAGPSYVPTKWYKPEKPVVSDDAVLKVYNTLTHSKVEFVPIEAGKVKWYSCGPTVYNPSHMGHARNYVSIDINRRILQDYFNYDVEFIQNVTDIDDKIILKARHEWLFDEFVKGCGGSVNDSVVSEIESAIAEYIEKNIGEDFTGQVCDFNKWSEGIDLKEAAVNKPKLPMHIKAVKSAIDAVSNKENMPFDALMNAVKDVVVEKLDSEKGSTVTDHSIFRKCSAYWERQFDEDMKKLNVMPPTVVTRVSEYVPEIVAYVEEIIRRGYAYVTRDGSVYFNTGKFDHSNEHQYAKCQPWSKGDIALVADGEGSLSNAAAGKLSPNDFALWKASKAGEPFWDSPWGPGRPGWHIECSVMGSDFVGDKMDIHSGGIDLAFPHHDNEMAQSEAHFECKQWVNYFLHTGHLHIEGQKMSKSLKNFITIDDALEKYSSRELRMVFALVPWNSPLDFKESLVREGRSVCATLDRFFSKTRALQRERELSITNDNTENGFPKKFLEPERTLYNELSRSKTAVHRALCDNLSTAIAIRALLELVNASNVYLAQRSDESGSVRVDLLAEVTRYITRMLSVFGFRVRDDKMGWIEEGEGKDSSESHSREAIAMPFVQILSGFRDAVRTAAMNSESFEELKRVIMERCDRVRDDELLSVGVAVDDRKDGSGALIKFLTAAEKRELEAQQQERARERANKAERAERARLAREREEAERRERARVPPEMLFQDKSLYGSWDSDGLPLTDASGVELSKSSRKKLAKQLAAHKKLHEAFKKEEENTK